MTKKALKIGALCIALLSCVLVFWVREVSAQSIKEVRVKINDWSSTCTWVDFDFWTKNVSASDQSYEISWTVNCSLLKGTWQSVKYTLTALTWSTTNTTIANSKVQLKNLWVTPTGTLNNTALQTSYAALSGVLTIYSKTNTQVWTMYDDLMLKITIPWWTPPDTYVWKLTLKIE